MVTRHIRRHAGISVNGIHSYYDLGMRMTSRNVSTSKELNAYIDDITERDGFIDYTTSWHRKYYGTRSASYSFVLLGAYNSEAMHHALEWIGNIRHAEIYDDIEFGWHLIGSITNAPDVTEQGRGKYCIIDLELTCQPYWIRDTELVKTYEEGAYSFDLVGQATRLVAEPANDQVYSVNVQLGDTEQVITEPTELLEEASPGKNLLVISNGSATIRWHQTRL